MAQRSSVATVAPHATAGEGGERHTQLLRLLKSKPDDGSVGEAVPRKGARSARESEKHGGKRGRHSTEKTKTRRRRRLQRPPFTQECHARRWRRRSSLPPCPCRAADLSLLLVLPTLASMYRSSCGPICTSDMPLKSVTGCMATPQVVNAACPVITLVPTLLNLLEPPVYGLENQEYVFTASPNAR